MKNKILRCAQDDNKQGLGYCALQKIKAIIQDDSLTDKECFCKIEAIVCLFGDLGIGCGNRHDFG